MRTTRRRKLSRRRQRGAGVPRWKLLLAALAALPPAAAGKLGIWKAVDKWKNNENPFNFEPSQDLANEILDPNNYGLPSLPNIPAISNFATLWSSSPPETAILPSQNALPSLEKGKRYKVTQTGTDSIREGDTVVYQGEEPVYDDDDNVIGTQYIVNKVSDLEGGIEDNPGMHYFIDSSRVDPTPVGGRRKQRRKTLRRKK